MSKQKKNQKQPNVSSIGESIRLNPERRLCPSYDNAGISLQLEPSRLKMGVRVVDDFCEEHIM
ncbi:MAG: hypothetical protein HFG20_04900 [Anaerotruncus sp.]|nr:hypothetical protein [Anaerotruncus sp.]